MAFFTDNTVSVKFRLSLFRNDRKPGEKILMTPEITSALRILYGDDVLLSPAMFKSLQQQGLKSVFRKRALELHPDRAAILGRNADEMSEAFKNVKSAYELLLDLLGNSLENTILAWFHDPSSPHQTTSAGSGDHYWDADIPRTPLLFGQFLYYAGLITLDTLLSAITWQRSGRPSFGKIARMWGYLSDDDIRDIISSREDGEKIGDSAFRTGRLTRFQCDTVLGFQRYMQRPIGEFFQEIGILREEEIDYLIRLMRRHNNSVGE